MTIAIHITAGNNENIRDSFNFKCFSRLAAEQPSHHFIFIFDTPPDPELYLDPNCTPVIVSPQLRNSLLRHYWYNYKIPGLLERYNANVFFSAGPICSMRTLVPQCMITDGFSLFPEKTGMYWKRFLPGCIIKAKAICVTNPLVKDTLVHKYKVAAEKISVLYPGPDQPVVPTDLVQVKEQHTEGRDFFFHIARSEAHLLIVLKAFSLFKKWQKSGMQLVIALQQSLSLAFSKDLANYKYREDIIFVQGAETLPAAYAAILAEGFEAEPGAGLQAMKCGVPVIALENDLARKIFADGVIYAQPDPKELSEKMMLLYKDEHLRKEYITKGYHIAAQYSWPKTASALWETVNRIANQ